jgi:general secretion pathway protein K
MMKIRNPETARVFPTIGKLPRPAAAPPGEGNPAPACGRPSRGGESEKTHSEIPSCRGVREERGGFPAPCPPRKRGAALILVMWVLVLVSLIVSSFAFEMKLESQIITAQRKRLRADYLALSGIELAKPMLAFEEDPLEGDEVVYDDPWLARAALVSDGVPVSVTEELAGGVIELQINFEEGRRGISSLTNDEWKELFEQTGVPAAYSDELLGCLKDWQDENDLHELNGAESDDSFYRDRGYKCKNAPIDTVDELLLIKGWTEEIVYGTPTNRLEETEYPMLGVAQYLTTWGSGKVNPNSASEEVLRSMYLSEDVIEAVMEMRLGPDGERGTEDDGLTDADFAQLGLDPERFTLKPEFAEITAVGDVDGLRTQISSVFKLGEKEPTPLFWLEER